MKEHIVKSYSFAELSPEAQQKALENLADINTTFDWWNSTYEDAANIGLKITGFDIDRGSYCQGDFMASAEETAHRIEKEHGEGCETRKTAAEYLHDRDAIIETAPMDENGDFESEYTLDKTLDELGADFLRSLLEDYRIMLQKEYEYLTSEDAIRETIEVSEYEFLENGKLF